MTGHELTTRWLLAFAVALGFVTCTFVPARAEADKGTLDIHFAIGLPMLLGNVADNDGDDPFDARAFGVGGEYAIGVFLRRSLGVGVFIEGENFGGGTLVTPAGAMDMNYLLGSMGFYGQYLFNSDRKLQPYCKLQLGWGGLVLEDPRTSREAQSDGKLDIGIGGGAIYLVSRHFGVSGEVMYQRGSVAGVEIDNEEPTARVLGTPRLRAHVGLHLMVF